MAEETIIPGRISSYRYWESLRLMTAVRLAFDPRKLAIAAGGLILLKLGWAVLNVLLPASAPITAELIDSSQPSLVIHESGIQLGQQFGELTFRLSEPIRILSKPLWVLFDPQSNWGSMIHALLVVVWLVVVSGLTGGAITRLAVIQEAQMRQPAIGEALQFAYRSKRSLIFAPLFPLVGILFCSTVGLVFGLLYRIPYGSVIAGVGLILPLMAGLVMTLLAAGLVAGWPLFPASLAAGADGALDALSRTYSYLNGRLGLYVVGVVLAGLVGLVGLVGVDLLATGVIHLTDWSIILSAGSAFPDPVKANGLPNGGTVTSATHNFWLGVVRLLAHGWIYSYFWTAAAFLHLWLRQVVDGTPRTEIDPPSLPSPSARSTPALAETPTSVDSAESDDHVGT